MNRRMKVLTASFIALSGLSYLIVSGLKESGIYYMKVGELVRSPPDSSKRVKVEGDILQGSLKKGEVIQFEITDGQGRIKVFYSGKAIPPNFREGTPVVVEGRYNPKDNSFQAERIITKCPSKYEAKGEKDDDR
ncbi:TPA: cytochrome c maturation protein CcmE [Candidatus Poribacteria bacterium]|nr:cytochrome c maturation protein CcmE [Candidatus Poribacteria bacterium]